VYDKGDHVNIRAIHAAYGTVPLRTYPFIDLKVKKYHQVVRGIRTHSLLNLVPYHKDDVRRLIVQELGWRDYGAKHHESVFTRFFQGHILPVKFKIDKRKAHLSNLIFSRQLTKTDALDELKKPVYDADLLREDMEFVLKKLELTASQFVELMREAPRPHTDFDHERSVYEKYPMLRPFRGIARRAHHILESRSAV
jgi:hypothetical protein